MAAWSAVVGELPTSAEPEQVRYAHGGELGRGGMGVVRSAVDRWLDRDVAVKRPHTDLSAENVERMMREARITARLVHPGIVPVWDVGEDEQGAYYTMPVLMGRTFAAELEEGTGDLRDRLDALLSVCRAVGYAHRCGVVHRDLKPENILLGELGEAWVLDWGVALELDHPDHAVVGTPGYQAPEQLSGEGVGPQADVYGLGRVLQDVLARESLPPPELVAVAQRCTDARPGARYADGVELSAELSRWREGHRVQAHAYTAAEILWRAARRWRAPLLVAGVAGVALLVTGIVALQAQQEERQRADRALATSLAWQAQQLLLEDRRPEAEVLAAHSLRLHDSPIARGVLMAAPKTSQVALREIASVDCRGGMVTEDGWSVCSGEQLRLLDAHGAERWEQPVERASQEGWDGIYVSAAHYGDTVVLKRSSNRIEIRAPGRAPLLSDDILGALHLASGSIPVVSDGSKVGRIALETGEVAWQESGCEGVQDLVATEAQTLVACRKEAVALSTAGGPFEVLSLEASPSAVTFGRAAVVGTFEGDLLFRSPDGWERYDSRVGAPVRVVPLSEGRLAVLGERGRVAIWSETARTLLAVLPSGVGLPVEVDGELWVIGDEVRRFVLPALLAPLRFDRSAGGGLSVFDVSPDGRWLAGGSASGEVVLWSTESGASRILYPSAPDVAKGVGFVSSDEVLAYRRGSGLEATDLETGGTRVFAPGFSREVRRWAGGLASVGWGNGVVVGQQAGETLLLPVRPLATAGHKELWVTDTLGAVLKLEGPSFKQSFVLPAPSGELAWLDGLLLTAADDLVQARTEQGELLWTTRLPARVSALGADQGRVAVGDVRGGVHVLSASGVVLASVVGHERLVSRVVFSGDALYSASWDGTARRWGLWAVDLPAEHIPELADTFEQTWGLTIESALAGGGSQAR